MAKIRVAQIKDLSLENGVITIGTGNAITPLTSVAPVNGTGANQFVSRFKVNGNTIEPVFTAVDFSDYYTSAEIDSTLADYAQTANITGSAAIAKVQDGIVTLRGGAILTNGVLTNNTELQDVTLAKIATTGEAKDVTISDDGNLITATTVEGALAELAGEIDTLTSAQLIAGSGIEIGTDHVISTTVTLNYDSTENVIQLLNKANGDVIGTVDAKAFLKDGMVSGATVVTNPEGRDEGTYIKLTFNTQDPVSGAASHEDIFINVTSLIDIYTAGNDGIKVDGRVISHKAGAVAANTQKGAVAENTIKVPVVKVDDYGHVIALTEVEWTMPASTALESVSGSTNDFITVAVGAKDQNKNQEITATATIGSFETDGANGLATTDDVKEYVANNASTTMYREVINVIDNAATLTYVPVGDIAITQNGLDLGAVDTTKEYTHTGKNVTFKLEVPAVEDDVFVAYYMYNPNTQPQAN